MTNGVILGTFERSIGEALIYRSQRAYYVFCTRQLRVVSEFPRTINVLQPQLKIWLLATQRLQPSLNYDRIGD